VRCWRGVNIGADIIASKPFARSRHPSNGPPLLQERSIQAVKTEPTELDRDAAHLLRRAQHDDRDAFDTLYEHHVGRIYAVCLRMSASRTEAERLTQDVFVRAWQRLKTFRGDSAFGSWLYRLAINVVLEDSRGTRRRESHHVTAGADDLVDALRGRAIHDDDRMDLERAIASLPAGARQVLILHDIEGYKHEEIARMTGTAVGTVKAQLHRARKLMRERL
jgi:RNA polymerase sigma factor (sigma-70 family)